MDFAGWLRGARIRREPRVSQDALASTALGLDQDGRSRFSQARVSEWEQGSSLPDLRQLELVCLALGCSEQERAEGRAAWEAVQLQGVPALVPALVVS